MLSGYRVDTLRVFRGQLAEDLDFCLDHPYPLACASRTARPVPSVVTDPAMYSSSLPITICEF